MNRLERKAVLAKAEAEVAEKYRDLSNHQKDLLMVLHFVIFYAIGVITALTYVWGWLKDLYVWIS